MAAYGGLYSTDTSTVPLTTTNVDLPLGTTLPVLNETYGVNSVTVDLAGDYELDYGMVGSTVPTSIVTMSVASNGTTIPSSIKINEFANGTPHTMTGSTIVTLPAGAVLTLQASSDVATTYTPTGDSNRYLIVKKLDNVTP